MDWKIITEAIINKCNPILFGELYRHNKQLIYYYQDDWSNDLEKSCSEDVWSTYCCDIETINETHPDLFDFDQVFSDGNSITCIIKLKK